MSTGGLTQPGHPIYDLKLEEIQNCSQIQVKMDCCTNDGCNWNLTTASGDLTWSDYTGGASLPSSSATVASARWRLYQNVWKSGNFGNLWKPGYNFSLLLFQHRELLDSLVHNRARRRRPPLLPLLLLLHQVSRVAASFKISRPFYRFSRLILHSEFSIKKTVQCYYILSQLQSKQACQARGLTWRPRCF